MSDFTLRLTDTHADRSPTAEPAVPSDLPKGLGWIRYQEAARRAGRNIDGVRRLCGETLMARGLARLEKRDGDRVAQWYVHESADPAFEPIKSVEVLSAQMDMRSLTDAQRHTLLTREQMVRGWDAYVASGLAVGMTRDAATRAYCAKHGVGRTTLFSWARDYRTRGRQGLIDGRAKAPIDSAKSGDAFRDLLIEIFFATRVNGLSVQRVYDIACYEAGRNAWPVVSRRTAHRWLDALPVAQVLHAKGTRHLKAFVDAVEPYQDRDYGSIGSNDWWCSDDHRFDVIVRDGENRDGTPRHVRPWLHAWQDVRSRKIVGYTIVTGDPNADIYLATICDAMAQWGVPKTAYVDNGKAFDSRKVQGVTKAQRQKSQRNGEKVVLSEPEIKRMGGALQALGIVTVHAWPFHGQSKPIERFFGTLCSRFAKTWDTYCGRSPSERPEGLADRVKAGKAPTLADFSAAFAEWLTTDYHARDHGGDSMGMTPDEAWIKHLAAKRVIDIDRMEFACRPRVGPVPVRQNGVTYSGMSFGQYAPELIERIGQKVMLVIPRDLSDVIVTDLDGRQICRAKANVKSPWAVDNAVVRTAIAEKKRMRKTTAAYHEVRPRLGLDIADLALRAAAEAARKAAGTAPHQQPPPILQPVRTPFDGQSNGVENLLDRPMKIAAGGEVTPPIIGQFTYTRTEVNDD